MKIDNIEKYNKDKIKEVDAHNKRLSEKIKNDSFKDSEYQTKNVLNSFCRSSISINWRERQYEEIFGHI